MTVSDEIIKEYYNEFLRSRAINYRIEGNLRVELATRFFLNNIKADDIVVDVGCGIGIRCVIVARVW